MRTPKQRPIFYAPAVAKNDEGKTLIYFGTGDEFNLTSDQVNYFYEIEDQGATGKQVWTRNLDPGEKVLSSPSVANWVVYFTTWTYTGHGENCGAGEGKLYGLQDLKSGSAGRIRRVGDLGPQHREMDRATELHYAGGWNPLRSSGHQRDDLYCHEFECKQGHSNSYPRVGCGENQIVEGSILINRGQVEERLPIDQNMPGYSRPAGGMNAYPLAGLCENLSLSLRATEGSAAISLFPIDCEIASVVSLPRNDSRRDVNLFMSFTIDAPQLCCGVLHFWIG